MERFATVKNIGGRRNKLDTICRCCGLQGDEMYPIIDGEVSEDGVDFRQKVSCLIGINVTKTDKMPQLMCLVCIDKINDFFEFRLMAENTDKQTRKALGLPAAAAEIKVLPQKIENIPSTSKKRAEAPVSVPQPPPKKSKKDVSCTICVDRHFGYQNDLNDHLIREHKIQFAKYACGSCRETFELLSDNKKHDAWHSRTKLPYTCFMCLSTFTRPKEFSKHLTNYSCSEHEKPLVTVEDIKCFQCKKKFLTQNLFEWHGCFLKTRGNCSKCGKYFAKKKMLFKHYVTCSGLFQAPASALDPIKFEGAKAKAPVKVSIAQPKGPKKKAIPNRKMSTLRNIVKTELHLNDAADDDAYSNYDEDITYDNFGNDSDTNDALEPVVELREQPAIRIKKEKSSDTPVVRQEKIVAATPDFAQIARNIKKEKGATPAIVTQHNNIWKLKIKAEKGAKDQTSTQLLNPLAVGAKKPGPKQVFKFPQELRMKIKLEKKDVGYGDKLEERDEAEPEDEDLMGDSFESSVVKIKREKLDPAYGDSRDSTVKKQFINPMALMRREKSIPNGVPENSLVIFAVTSINTDSTGRVNEALVSQSDVQKTPETPETNDATVLQQKDKNLAMVQIPTEQLESIDNHSSPSVAQCDKSSEDNSNVTSNPTKTNDELDTLLKNYESQTPSDNGDIFQDLLRSD